MEPAQPARDPMDVAPVAEATPKGPSMTPRAVKARREAVQKNDQHIVLVKEAVAKALAEYKAGEDKRTAGADDQGTSNANQEIDLREELRNVRENQEVMQKTQLEVMDAIFVSLDAVVENTRVFHKRFDTHMRLVRALNEKQALNECDTVGSTLIGTMEAQWAAPKKKRGRESRRAALSR